MIQDFHGFLYNADVTGDLAATVSRFLGTDDGELLLVSGPSSSGKTALAKAIIAEAREHGKSASKIATMEYVEKLLDRHLQGASTSLLIPDCMGYDLIVIEDYDYIVGKTSTQQEMCSSLLTPLLAQGKKIVITLIDSPERLRLLHLPNHSRIDIPPADISLRTAFARACMREQGLERDESAEKSLAENYPIYSIKASLQHTALRLVI